MQPQGEKKTLRKTRLVESEEAVFDLLESLLQEVDAKPVSNVEVAVEPGAGATLEDQAEVQSETEKETLHELQTEQQTDNVKIFQQLPLEMQESLIAQATEELKIKNSLPAWVEHTIPCLLVDVEGFELAVPLILLNGISEWNQETMPMPTQPDWHLGVIEYRGENVVIVDTARLIMPEKITQTADERRESHASHFLRVGKNLALSCNEIIETVSLRQDEVRWRITRSARPWAVGILIERLSVLLDTDVLLQEIEVK
jgi:purine-binding chemotaxis protein CheW